MPCPGVRTTHAHSLLVTTTASVRSRSVHHYWPEEALSPRMAPQHKVNMNVCTMPRRSSRTSGQIMSVSLDPNQGTLIIALT